MNKFLILAGLVFLSLSAQAENSSERVRVNGFRCDYSKAGIHLRSLEEDRVLYLAKNLHGEPKALTMLEQHCNALIKNLSNKLAGRILDVDFHTDTFSRKEFVYVPPRNPCRPGRTKCEDEGEYVEKTFNYRRTETVIDGYRFFSEESPLDAGFESSF